MAKYALRAFGGPVIYNDGSGYMVLISGQPVAVEATTLSIDNTIGRRSSASFTVRSDTPRHFQQYEQVLIYDSSTTLIFSGYITGPKEERWGYQGKLLHNITCCDQHYLADKRRVLASYTNRTCGYIAQDLIKTVLASEGVTIGQIYDGLTPSPYLYPSPTLYPGGNVGLIPLATFTYCKASEALDALTQQASAAGVPYYWMIDQLKRFWFVPYTAIVNTSFDSSQIDDTFTAPTVTRANPTYRNTQIITGGVQQTVTQNESRIGDNNTTAWTMSFDLASTPTISVNSTSKTVGINGVDSGKDFYWSKGSNTITQDSSGTKLSGTDTLHVTYIGQYPSTVISSDDAQVQYQASVDGTSGIVEDVQSDATLTSVSSGLTEASQLLTRYATQGLILEFLTHQSGLAPGQLITVDLPDFGISSAQMLIEDVSASDQTDGVSIWYAVKAIQGPYDTTWVDFFSKLLAQPQTANSINVGVSQTVTILQQMSLGLAVSMGMTATTYSCPLPSPTQYPSSTLYPC